ncbi:RNaseH domain-containing protein [Pseudomonas savastanoi]|uniref:RNaseH domain-containing protein n=1 Tax=Pseudomonas savastanoi TaxID=29438 RepID=UPI000EFFEB12|nr:RNaseH domain-containing protein [Pseudomonas savastanoi]RML93239.1 hypothetical protein ALQ87_03973 [Pseudomonas savastanoi pv. glycinea]
MSRFVLRKSLFKFDPRSLGKVYRAQVADGYVSTWQALQNHFEKPHPGLPTHALEQLLAVSSGGPVKVNLFPQRDGGVSAILMLAPLSVAKINEVLQLWILEALRSIGASTRDIEAKLEVDDLVEMDAASLVVPGDISSLAYTAIPWLVGRAMCSAPLSLTSDVTLRQAADGSLLTWDNPVLAQSGKRTYSAMHTVDPQLVLLRDCPTPYIQLRARFAQCMHSWAAGKKKNAWVDTGKVIVKTRLKTRYVDGAFDTSYDFPTSNLLTFLGHPGFAPIVDGDIAVDSLVRPIYAVPPSSPVIGTGARPLFLDALGFHLMKTLPGTEPLTAHKAVTILRTSDQGEPSPNDVLPIAVLTAHSAVVLRLENASNALRARALSDKNALVQAIDLKQLNVANAADMLEGRRSSAEVIKWLNDQVIPAVKKTSAEIVIVETSAQAAEKSPDQDPKHLIRRHLAQHGLVTQFIMHTDPAVAAVKKKSRKKTEDERDFKAMNTLIESVRLSGYLPHTFPKAKAVADGTTVLSVYLDRLQQPGPAKYLPVVTRTVVGSQSAEVFWAAPDAPAGRWYPFTEGVAAIHATTSLHGADGVKQLVAQALMSPTTIAESPLIVCLDSNLRTFYGALKDSPGQGLPPVPAGASIVRIRADEHVAQITGDHSKDPSAPKFIGTRMGVYQSFESPAVYYFVSSSNQYLALRSHRHSTRYDVNSRGLRDFWQQLGVTEITVIEPGQVASPTAIAEQIALLCRNAPLWDGQLRLPSPMHLGAQIAGDHPSVEMKRKAEANRAA